MQEEKWNTQKAESNIKKHNLTFEEAEQVFDDPFLLELYDDVNSTIDEDRYIVIGRVKNQIVVNVVYTPRNGIRRIITARYATSKEWKMYYEQFRN